MVHNVIHALHTNQYDEISFSDYLKLCIESISLSSITNGLHTARARKENKWSSNVFVLTLRHYYRVFHGQIMSEGFL